MVQRTRIPGALCLLEWRCDLKTLTPGGALANTARSFAKLTSSGACTVKPHRESLTRDSLAVVSGTTKDVSLHPTAYLAADDYGAHP